MRTEDFFIDSEEKMSELKRFALLPKFNDKLKYLSSIAEPENWDFPDSKDVHPVLFQYLHHTFKRLVAENKILFYDDDSIALFNTGLMTRNGEDIYGMFKRTSNDPLLRSWYLDSFYKESDRTLIAYAGKLPMVADYYAETGHGTVDSFLMPH